jgi:hypothetical protein
MKLAPVMTLFGPTFDRACADLMRLVEADYAPTHIVGIRTGGLTVANAMAAAASAALPVLPLTCRRVTTGTKSRLPLLRSIPGALPRPVGRSAAPGGTPLRHSGPAAAWSAAGGGPHEVAAIAEHMGTLSGAVRLLVADDAVDSGTTCQSSRDCRMRCPTGSEVRTAVITQTLTIPSCGPIIGSTIAHSAGFGRSMRLRDMAPVVVFDLDGTVLDVNSFPHWVMFLIGARAGDRRPPTAAAVPARHSAGATAQAYAHEPCCAPVAPAGAWRSASRQPGRIASAVRGGAGEARARPNLGRVLQLVATGEIDARHRCGGGLRCGSWSTASISPCAGSRSGRRRDDPANSGTRKRGQVLALLARGWDERPIILFTDHIDDPPLMRDSSTVLVRHIGRDARAVAAAGGVSFIRCSELLRHRPCGTARDRLSG